MQLIIVNAYVALHAPCEYRTDRYVSVLRSLVSLSAAHCEATNKAPVSSPRALPPTPAHVVTTSWLVQVPSELAYAITNLITCLVETRH